MRDEAADECLRTAREQLLPRPNPQLMKLSRPQLVDELMRRRPELTNRKLLSHFTKAKLARMIDAAPAVERPIVAAGGMEAAA